MFSRRSANSLPKDSEGTPPLDVPAPTLNSGLSFALMEERACVSLLQKLSGTHLEGKVWNVVCCVWKGEGRGGEGKGRGEGRNISGENGALR